MAHFYNNIASNIQKQITQLSLKVDAIDNKLSALNSIREPTSTNKSDEKVDMIKSEVLIIKTDLQKHMTSIKDEIAKERSILESAIMLKVDNLLKNRTNGISETIMKQVNDLVQQIKVEQQVSVPLSLSVLEKDKEKAFEAININDVIAPDAQSDDIEININKKKTILRRKP